MNPPLDLDRIKAFIESSEWRYAKSMPQLPHSYVLREWSDEIEFQYFVQAVRDHGYQKNFFKRVFIYLEIDGYKYWSMGAPVNETTVLNRAILPAYHSALHEDLTNITPIDRVELPTGSIAFTHDIMNPLPVEYQTCDVLYTEIPWHKGLEVYDRRAGVQGRTYAELIGAIERIIDRFKIITVLPLGKTALKMLPEPDQTSTVTINGAASMLAVYHGFLPIHFQTDIQVSNYLAINYQRVGDFCCGYGRIGRIFQEHGKTFVMSDYNPKCIGYIKQSLMP